jgi:hypothetical protein
MLRVDPEPFQALTAQMEIDGRQSKSRADPSLGLSKGQGMNRQERRSLLAAWTKDGAKKAHWKSKRHAADSQLGPILETVLNALEFQAGTGIMLFSFFEKLREEEFRIEQI